MCTSRVTVKTNEKPLLQSCAAIAIHLCKLITKVMPVKLIHPFRFHFMRAPKGQVTARDAVKP